MNHTSVREQRLKIKYQMVYGAYFWFVICQMSNLMCVIMCVSECDMAMHHSSAGASVRCPVCIISAIIMPAGDIAIKYLSPVTALKFNQKCMQGCRSLQWWQKFHTFAIPSTMFKFMCTYFVLLGGWVWLSFHGQIVVDFEWTILPYVHIILFSNCI
jgi:hypothetical protein